MSGFDREPVAGAEAPGSQYRIPVSAAWGAALSYAHRPQWGLRADLDAVGPVRIDEVSRNAVVNGQSVAWLGGLSLTYTPALLCTAACVTLSAGPGAGFYELGQHTEVARRSFIVSKTQFTYATRAEIGIRAPGRFKPLKLSISDYIINFAPAVGSSSLTTLHHVVLSLGWTPP